MGLKASRIRVPGPAGHDDPAAVALCTRAAAGDKGAWDEIVERYAPMVWSICTGFRLNGRDLEDVAQNVWLLLVEQLGKFPDPAALAGWLAVTTRRECRRMVTAARGPEPPEPPEPQPRPTRRSSWPNGMRRCGRRSPSSLPPASG